MLDATKPIFGAEFDAETRRRFADLSMDVVDAEHHKARQRRLQQLLVLVWNCLDEGLRHRFLGRLRGVEFDRTPWDMRTIMSSWDWVIDSGLQGADRKFADDIQWRRKKHRFYRPKKDDEPRVRALFAFAVERVG